MAAYVIPKTPGKADTGYSEMGNSVPGVQDAIDEWMADEVTHADILSQLPMACLLTVSVADHVAGRVYQVAQDSALAGLSAAGWAALLAVEVAS